jgi:hypothetical protein
MFMGPRNWFQGMNSASLCSLAGRYENPIPPRCLAPKDFLKIPAQNRASVDRLPCILVSINNLYICFAQCVEQGKNWFFSFTQSLSPADQGNGLCISHFTFVWSAFSACLGLLSLLTICFCSSNMENSYFIKIKSPLLPPPPPPNKTAKNFHWSLISYSKYSISYI